MQSFGISPLLQAGKIAEVSARSMGLGGLVRRMLEPEPSARLSSAAVLRALEDGTYDDGSTIEVGEAHEGTDAGPAKRDAHASSPSGSSRVPSSRKRTLVMGVAPAAVEGLIAEVAELNQRLNDRDAEIAVERARTAAEHNAELAAEVSKSKARAEKIELLESKIEALESKLVLFTT